MSTCTNCQGPRMMTLDRYGPTCDECGFTHNICGGCGSMRMYAEDAGIRCRACWQWEEVLKDGKLVGGHQRGMMRGDVM